MDTTPTANDLWEGIGGHFDSFTQVICEFIDNSIANFEGKNTAQRSVNINIETMRDDRLKVSIEDTGSGIGNFQPVLRLGDKSARHSPLNEHGFGMKHAIASANPDNNVWKIYTRTEEDFHVGKYTVVSSPYSFDMTVEEVQINENGWPGIFNGTGTIIEFECTMTLFNTVQRGIRGEAGFERCIDYLSEELGYIYSGVIEKGLVNINIQLSGTNRPIEMVRPDWVDFYAPGQGEVNYDLGGGELTIEYQFGEMRESAYVKHYKRNMSTNGLEIRANGRLLIDNLFKDIWMRENHPTYNHFLVVVNIVSSDLDALPKTRTSKNGIRTGDEKLEKLFDWIRNTHPHPKKLLAGAVKEKELVEKLAEIKDQQIRDPTKHIEMEFEVFTNLGSPIPVDLYVYDGTDVVLYEAKKDNADIRSVYQLLMYWDGAVSDGLTPDEGIIIASTFSDGVDEVLELINSMQDQNGNNYNFSRKTWCDESIEYPAP